MSIEQKREDVLAVIDLGSSKTTVLVGEAGADGSLTFLGYGHAETKGVRKGLVSNLKDATDTVKRAVDDAEKMTGLEIATVVVSIGGSHIKGVNSRGGISLGNRQREVSREDVRAALERARSVQFPADRQILHLLPQEFLIDEQPGIQDPLGMTGSKLEVNLHIVTASASAVQSVVTAVNKAGIHAEDTVFEGVAVAETLSGLGESERILGACVVDIGAGSTEIVCYYDGAVIYTASIGVGGEHFINDAAVLLKCSLQEAQRLVCTYGSAVVTSVPSDSVIEVAANGSVHQVSQRFLAEVLEPRARELFELVRNSLRAGGASEFLRAGIFLTGGGSRLNMVDEICRQVLRCPVFCERGLPLMRMPGELVVPEMACATGLLAYAHRTRSIKKVENEGFKNKLLQLFAGA